MRAASQPRFLAPATILHLEKDKNHCYSIILQNESVVVTNTMNRGLRQATLRLTSTRFSNVASRPIRSTPCAQRQLFTFSGLRQDKKDNKDESTLKEREHPRRYTAEPNTPKRNQDDRPWHRMNFGEENGDNGEYNAEPLTETGKCYLKLLQCIV